MGNRISGVLLHKCSQLLNYTALVRGTAALTVEKQQNTETKNLSNMEWPGTNPGPPTWQEGVYPPEPLSYLALFTRMSFRLQLLFKDMTVRRRQRRANSLIAGVVRISERFGNFPASLINKWLVHGPFGKDALDSIRGWKLFELVKLQIDGCYRLHYKSCMSRH